MKKILIFSLAYYPKFIGGDAVAIKEITDRTPPKDIEFHMITLRFDSMLPKVERLGNVMVYRIGFGKKDVGTRQTYTPLFYISKILFIPLAVLKAIRLNRQHHFDGLWAMMSYMVFPIVLMRLFGFKTPFILTLQEGETYERVFKSWYIVPLLSLLDYGFRHATVVQTISNFLGEWARRRGFEGPLEVIPNGFNSSALTHGYLPHELDELKKKLGIKQDEIVLVTVSRLVKKNAVDDVIRALPFLSRRVRLLIVGGGPDEEELKKLAHDRKVSSQTIFVGRVDTSETTKYRKISSIFIRPSRSEGMGNSFVSSMALGLPVIATQEGGIADFLFDAKRDPGQPTTGWAVDTDSPEQIAEAVDDILDHPEKTKKVIETARNLVLTKYNWDTIAKDMQDKVFSRLFAK